MCRAGFWCHQFDHGLPVDLIAVRNGRPFLFACKVCSDENLDIWNIGKDQLSAMERWSGCGNASGWLAFELESEIRVMDFDTILSLRHESSLHVLNRGIIEKWTVSLEWWMKYAA